MTAYGRRYMPSPSDVLPPSPSRRRARGRSLSLFLHRHALALLPGPPSRIGEDVLPPPLEHAPLVGGPLEPLYRLDVRPPKAAVEVRVPFVAAAAAGWRLPPYGASDAGQPDLEYPEGGVAAEEEVCRDGELMCTVSE